MAKKVSKKEEQLSVALAEEAPPPIPADQAGELDLAEMAGDAGQGFENITAQDIAIPFIMILQSGSPQIKRGPNQIEGAKEGDIFNSVTGEFYDGSDGIYYIPAFYKKAWVEWTPRESGGGFVRQHETDAILSSTVKNEKGQDTLPNGNIIVTTAYHYGLLTNADGSYSRTVISFTSTQLKKSRKWNSVMMGIMMPGPGGKKFTPPMFSHLYHLTTEPESNSAGSWSGWKVELYSTVPSRELYDAAKKFAMDLKQGVVKEQVPQAESPDSDVPY